MSRVTKLHKICQAANDGRRRRRGRGYHPPWTRSERSLLRRIRSKAWTSTLRHWILQWRALERRP